MLSRTRTLSLTAALLLTAGCAGLKGQSDEEQVADIVDSWLISFQEFNVEVAEKIYSEDFTSDFMENKDAVIQSLGSAEFKGFIGNADIDIAEVVITVEGDTATAESIYIESDEFGFELLHTLAKESDGWKIVETGGNQL
jgi:ketosteroid isomerase-like protein